MAKIEIAVTENDLFAAMSELFNSGSVEWVSTDGQVVTLVDPERCPYCGERFGPEEMEFHLQLCTPN